VTVTQDVAPPVAAIDAIGQLTCTVNQITLDASRSRGNSGSIGSYSWSGAILGGQGTDKVTIGKPGGVFVVQVKDNRNGCIDTDTISITEIGNPLADLLVDPVNPKCFGERNGTITVNQVLDQNNQPLGNLQFSFNGGPFSSNRSYTNLAQGSYKITVRDPNGCLLERTYQLVEPSKLGISVIKSIVVDQGTTVRVDSLLLALTGGTVDQNNQYRDTTWFNIDDQVDWESKLSYVADTTREFLITGIDQAGCEITERVRVIVRIIKDVWWPTAFSPNDDRVNDFFNVYGKRVRNVRLLQVYDRWGSMVYSREDIPDGNKDPQVGWNGYFKGQRALPGVYAFYAEVEYEGSTGFEEVKGEFTLIR
jgi:gliding motility-associated-like protein